MKPPNFFIIGAPKCGTTSLASWLSSHPEVFFSKPKELHWYSSDLANLACVQSQTQYMRAFRGAMDTHKAVGEGSTLYLYSKTAAARIRKLHPDARFIVCLRDPIEMALSWHGQCVRLGWQRETEFARAWQVSRNLDTVTTHAPDPALLDYGAICSVGEQISRLLDVVPPARTHIVELAAMRDAPEKVFRDACDFLGIREALFDPRHLNKAHGLPPIVQALTTNVDRWKRRLGWKGGTGLIRQLHDRTSRDLPRPTLTPALQAELKRFFAEDQARLSKLRRQYPSLAERV